MNRFYAVGDIHGDYDKLIDIHARIARDAGAGGDPKIIFIGDLVDRRFKSGETLQFLIDNIAAGRPWTVVLGNHDRLFARFLDDVNWRDPVLRADYHWLHANMGGVTTLASYGVDVSSDRTLQDLQNDARAKVPADHHIFLKNLPDYHREPGLLFVHAGIRPGVPLSEQTQDDMIWIRKPFHDYAGSHGDLVIHGHSVIDRVTHYGNRVNIDTGAAYGHDLSAIVIEGADIYVLEKDGRRKLTPDTGR